MKQGLNEIAINKMLKYQDMASRKIVSNLKSDRLVSGERLSRDELLLAKSMLGVEDLNALRAEFGSEAVIKFFYGLNQFV
ncbi:MULTISPECIES: hypothetical protein [Dehalococcoides]|jgi:hypothetical protein|uniref:Uncharacterized protein n=1 Tax=Dehalococcoides mccartyi TaxID=61435 RepID=A0A1S7AU11_9CHLR|nr:MULTISPECIES: hypothetical protein [Dehalococcoides]AGG06550.1 hypothetical protein dcmb_944 [Dehalococcoides mccartyi DCMB5]AGG08040.1 hypothetical protein btf_958 [Dehalococcoides mccartyi BTF08]AQU06022.1 hypothetical protein B1777_04845 [Dehalococcoides mccartyi]AQU07467.1 hypothetical protein B1778_04660 [Dehalococcoides mccartyi]AQW62568.1 hypothetical protein B1779_04660 [Dehalococcoides mccartyi]